MIFQESDQKSVRSLWVDLQPEAVQTKENVGGKERNAFVTVHERVVHDQRLEERCRHFGKIIVVAGPGTIQCAFQQPEIANPGGTAEVL